MNDSNTDMSPETFRIFIEKKGEPVTWQLSNYTLSQ